MIDLEKFHFVACIQSHDRAGTHAAEACTRAHTWVVIEVQRLDLVQDPIGQQLDVDLVASFDIKT